MGVDGIDTSDIFDGYYADDKKTNKYIIKNCPIQESKCHPFYKSCQDSTDCVMKQIYEKCKNVQCPCEYKGADCWECDTKGAKSLAEQILQLFEIEEKK